MVDNTARHFGELCQLDSLQIEVIDDQTPYDWLDFPYWEECFRMDQFEFECFLAGRSLALYKRVKRKHREFCLVKRAITRAMPVFH